MRLATSDSNLQVLAALLNGVEPGQGRWDTVVQEANRHLVAPALYACFRDRGLLGLIPAEVENYLRFLHGLNEERNRRLKQQAIEILSALNEAGIEPLLIKGSALLMIIPEHRLGTRMISDLDLVVDKGAVERSVARLLSIGYQTLPDNPGACVREILSAVRCWVPWTCICGLRDPHIFLLKTDLSAVRASRYLGLG